MRMSIYRRSVICAAQFLLRGSIESFLQVDFVQVLRLEHLTLNQGVQGSSP